MAGSAHGLAQSWHRAGWITLRSRGQVPEAIDLLQDLVQVRPDCKLAWNTLGGMLVRCKRYMKARDTLVQALVSTMN
jgi:Flp pilus assembly protein TadD